MYIGFLLGEPKQVSCSHLGEVMGISHDSATRFLQREHYDGKDLFNESAPLLNVEGGRYAERGWQRAGQTLQPVFGDCGLFSVGQAPLPGEGHQP